MSFDYILVTFLHSPSELLSFSVGEEGSNPSAYTIRSSTTADNPDSLHVRREAANRVPRQQEVPAAAETTSQPNANMYSAVHRPGIWNLGRASTQHCTTSSSTRVRGKMILLEDIIIDTWTQ